MPFSLVRPLRVLARMGALKITDSPRAGAAAPAAFLLVARGATSVAFAVRPRLPAAAVFLVAFPLPVVTLPFAVLAMLCISLVRFAGRHIVTWLHLPSTF